MDIACVDYEALMHDVSKRMASSQLSRRPSRGSTSNCSTQTRRSVRIEKPRSIHNSPMGLERRKTTSGARRYTTLEDHWDYAFRPSDSQLSKSGHESESRKHPTRPVSWHPASTQVSFRSTPTELREQPVYPPGDLNPDHMSLNNDNNQTPLFSSLNYDLDAPSGNCDVPVFDYTECSTPLGPFSPTTTSSWQKTHDLTSTTSHPEPNLLTQSASSPRQSCQHIGLPQARALANNSSEAIHPDISYDIGRRDRSSLSRSSSRELIGMGLYDTPQSSLWSGSGILPATGKGLKLEEEWHPPANDDEDESSSDEESVDEEVPHNTRQPQPHQPEPQVANHLVSQGFFGDDENYAEEWWYQQLKYPTIKGTQMGYGWL